MARSFIACEFPVAATQTQKAASRIHIGNIDSSVVNWWSSFRISELARKLGSGAAGGQYGGSQVTYSRQGPEAMQVQTGAVPASKSILVALVMIWDGLMDFVFWPENGCHFLHWCHFLHFHQWSRKKSLRSKAPPVGPKMQRRQLVRIQQTLLHVYCSRNCL